MLGKAGAGGLVLPSTTASSHTDVCGCGCAPAAVTDSPGSWGRCLVTFSESKEDLKTQSPPEPVLQKGTVKPQEPRLSLPATLGQR